MRTQADYLLPATDTSPLKARMARYRQLRRPDKNHWLQLLILSPNLCLLQPKCDRHCGLLSTWKIRAEVAIVRLLQTPAMLHKTLF
jgi:hypothetical protein